MSSFINHHINFMNLESWGINKRKGLVVLGAGASYGASFVKRQNTVLPPLDDTFFRELQGINDFPAARNLLKFAWEEFDNSQNLSMEDFFSQVDYIDKFNSAFKIDKGPKVRKFGTALDYFYKSLPILFKKSIGDQSCNYHEILINILHSQDSIISFNYDCLIDTALKNCAEDYWRSDVKAGYGIPILTGKKTWFCDDIKKRGTTPIGISLLKPHGSLNWKIVNTKGGAALKLIKKPYEQETAEGKIIPPTWVKDVNFSPFNDVWKKTRIALRSCKALIVIGYSVPKTDLFSQALFRVESKGRNDKLDLLIIVNPDKETREDFQTLMHSSMGYKTKIFEYSTFSDFAKFLDPDKATPMYKSQAVLG